MRYKNTPPLQVRGVPHKPNRLYNNNPIDSGALRFANTPYYFRTYSLRLCVSAGDKTLQLRPKADQIKLTAQITTKNR